MHSPTFWILQLWVTVNSSIANVPISRVEDICQLSSFKWAWHSADENSFSGINRLSVIHNEVTVGQLPWPDLNLKDKFSSRHAKLDCASVKVPSYESV